MSTLTPQKNHEGTQRVPETLSPPKQVFRHAELYVFQSSAHLTSESQARVFVCLSLTAARRDRAVGAQATSERGIFVKKHRKPLHGSQQKLHHEKVNFFEGVRLGPPVEIMSKRRCPREKAPEGRRYTVSTSAPEFRGSLLPFLLHLQAFVGIIALLVVSVCFPETPVATMSAPEAGSGKSACPPEVLEAIYGEKKFSENKKEAYEESLRRCCPCGKVVSVANNVQQNNMQRLSPVDSLLALMLAEIQQCPQGN